MVSDVQRSLEQLLDALATAGRPVWSHLRPGLSSQEIEQRCRAADIVLPPELFALYQFCDGIDPSGLLMGDYCLIHYFFLIPLDGVLEDHQTIREEAEHNEGEASAAWFPFLDGEGDQYVIDIEAVQQEKPAIIWRIRELWPTVIYSNLTSMFDTLAECYRQGAYAALAETEKDNELLIAQISVAHNPDVPYWKERLQKLKG